MSHRCLSEDALVAIIERRTDGPGQQAASEHLDDCDSCRGLLVEWARHFVDDADVGPTSLAAGAEVDHYVVTRELGRGARGVVYLARDTALGREVVLKFAAREDDAHERAALVAEAKTLAALAHPNVVRIFGLAEWRGHVYLAMEAVDGVDLRSWLARGNASADDVRRLLHDVANGLRALHRAGIVHRDVKPENIVVGGDGVARIIDLDLAHRHASRQHTRRLDAARAAGTPCYMPPEARAGAVPSAAVDVYGFCTTALEALGLASPFDERRAPPSRSASRIAPGLSRILWRGVDPDPSRRPTMAELAAALSACSPRRVRRAPALAFSGLALVAGAAAVVACAGPPRRPAETGEAPVAILSVTAPATAPAAMPRSTEGPRSLTESAPEPAVPVATTAARSLGGSTLIASASRHQSAGVSFPLDPFVAPPPPGRSFDRAAAARALSGVDVKRCSSAAGIPRQVMVTVTFRPRGDVERAVVVKAGRSRTCLEQAFKTARVTPYVGGSAVAMRTFTVIEPEGPRS